MKTAKELLDYYQREIKKTPNAIFAVHDLFLQLSESEKEMFQESGIGDSISMRYITAVEMKKRDEWEAYLREWEEKREN